MFIKTPSVSRLLGSLLLLPLFAAAQDTIRHDDLSFWKTTGQKNWQIAGDVSAAIDKADKMTATKGAVFDALNIPDAISGMVNVIAEHCTNTGEHPANIIPSGTVFQ